MLEFLKEIGIKKVEESDNSLGFTIKGKGEFNKGIPIPMVIQQEQIDGVLFMRISAFYPYLIQNKSEKEILEFINYLNLREGLYNKIYLCPK